MAGPVEFFASKPISLFIRRVFREIIASKQRRKLLKLLILEKLQLSLWMPSFPRYFEVIRNFNVARSSIPSSYLFPELISHSRYSASRISPKSCSFSRSSIVHASRPLAEHSQIKNRIKVASRCYLSETITSIQEFKRNKSTSVSQPAMAMNNSIVTAQVTFLPSPLVSSITIARDRVFT